MAVQQGAGDISNPCVPFMYNCFSPCGVMARFCALEIISWGVRSPFDAGGRHKWHGHARLTLALFPASRYLTGDRSSVCDLNGVLI